MRFAIEIVEAVRANWPDNKPLFVRLSVEDGAGWGPEQSVALTRLVKPLGVDVVDCSSGGLRGSPVIDADKITYGYQVPYAEQIGREADINCSEALWIENQSNRICTSLHCCLRVG